MHMYKIQKHKKTNGINHHLTILLCNSTSPLQLFQIITY